MIAFRVMVCLIASLILSPMTSVYAQTQNELRVCLLTGFEPFGSVKANPSWEAIEPLQGQTIYGYRIVTLRLPVVYDEMAHPLEEALRTHKPQVAISFGVADRTFQLEAIARNGYHTGRYPDNKRQRPQREKIIAGAADELRSTLPLDELVAFLNRRRWAVVRSDDAGGYLCNECFYRLMQFPDPENRLRMRGFVHVPQYDKPNAFGGTFTREILHGAIREIVEAILKVASETVPDAPSNATAGNASAEVKRDE